MATSEERAMELRKRSSNDKRYLQARKYLESIRFHLFKDSLSTVVSDLKKRWEEIYIRKRIRPNPNRGFTTTITIKNPDYVGEYSEYDKKLSEIIYDLDRWQYYHDSILIDNKSEDSTPNYQAESNPKMINSEQEKTSKQELQQLIENHKNRISGKYDKNFFRGFELLKTVDRKQELSHTDIEIMVDALKKFGIFDDNKEAKMQACSALKMYHRKSDQKKIKIGLPEKKDYYKVKQMLVP